MDRQIIRVIYPCQIKTLLGKGVDRSLVGQSGVWRRCTTGREEADKDGYSKA